MLIDNMVDIFDQRNEIITSYPLSGMVPTSHDQDGMNAANINTVDKTASEFTLILWMWLNYNKMKC